jgi:hypothetical protein
MGVLMFNQVPKLLEGLPSWVPDWGWKLLEPLGYEPGCSPGCDTPYNASGGFSSVPRFSGDLRGLYVNAVFFDRINYLLHVPGASDTEHGKLYHDVFLNISLPLYDSCKHVYKTPGSVQEAFWSTMSPTGTVVKGLQTNMGICSKSSADWLNHHQTFTTTGIQNIGLTHTPTSLLTV